LNGAGRDFSPVCGRELVAVRTSTDDPAVLPFGLADFSDDDIKLWS